MSNEIIQIGNNILRLVSEPVVKEHVGSPTFQKFVKKMQKILSGSPDGVALAAPQIGKNLRIFIISPRVFGENITTNEHLIYINPIIKKRSVSKKEYDEGCLSVRNIYGHIKRSEKVTIEALDEHGRKFARGGSGLLAEIFQHEIDHLDGILFVDKAKNLREIKPDETRRN